MNGNERNEVLNGEVRPPRRRVLGWLVAVMNLAVGAVVIGPVLGFVASPMRRRAKATWVPVTDDSALATGQTKEVQYFMRVRDGYSEVDRKYTVFLHRYADRVVAFDPACTHLGCRITWVGDKNRYLCPCHGGVFDPDGKVVSGPPPKPLDAYPVKVENGKIWIQRKV